MDDAVLRSHAFQGANGGGPHADDAAAGGPGVVDGLGGLLRHPVELLVHPMVLYVLLADGTEGAQAHMQKDVHDLHALFLDRFQKLRGEVEPGGGGCSAAPGDGVDGLVSLLIGEALRDIGRQGHLAGSVQHLLEDAGIQQLHPLSALHGRVPQDLHGELGRHLIDRACLGPFGGLAEAFPNVPLQAAKEQKLHGAAGLGSVPDKPCGNDPGVVSHQHVPGVQMVQHVREHPVCDGSVLSVVDEQPGLAPHGGRGLGDQLPGQIIVKVACFQDAPRNTDSSLLYISDPFGATEKKHSADKGYLFYFTYGILHIL